MMYLLKCLGLPLLAYLLGSIPFGLVFTRWLTSIDLRASGSGNIGATNVRRTAGSLLGWATLLADGLKGALPVWAAVATTGSQGFWPQLYAVLVASAAVSGHLFPVYSKFRGGGKGVATAAGCFCVLSPPAVVVSILVFTLFVCLTDRVSVGSLAAAAVLPLAVWQASGSVLFTGFAAGLALVIVYRHRTNIARMLTGKEPPL